MRVRSIFAVALGAQLAALAGTPAPASGQSIDWAGMKARLEARIAEHKGAVGVAVIDLASGETLSIRGDERFPTASNIKIPVLLELFTQVERGRIKLSDPVVMLDVDRVGGSGILQHFDAPLEMTVKDAATFMINQSDNTGTNLVVDKLGIRAINERMDSLGYPGTKLWAKVSRSRQTSIDPDSSRVWGLGVTTPMENARMFASMYKGEAVSAEASKQMIGMARTQAWGYNEIPRYLPSGVVVAHKTGSVSATRNDCGIVFTQRPRGKTIFDPPQAGVRDYVVCVYTNENEDRGWQTVDNAAEVLIGDLSLIVWKVLNPAPPPA
ncbi:MAG: serine hydrolase [Longimicrobiales bacterium]